MGERTGGNCCDLCSRRNLCLYRKKKHWNWHRQKMQEYLQDNAVCSMDEYVQHGTTSTLQHCLSVVRISCAIAVGLHIHVNYENLILGALLHDFYLYDWHNHVDEGCAPRLCTPNTYCLQKCGNAVSCQCRGAAYHHHTHVALDAAVCAPFQRSGDRLPCGQVLLHAGNGSGHGSCSGSSVPEKEGLTDGIQFNRMCCLFFRLCRHGLVYGSLVHGRAGTASHQPRLSAGALLSDLWSRHAGHHPAVSGQPLRLLARVLLDHSAVQSAGIRSQCPHGTSVPHTLVGLSRYEVQHSRTDLSGNHAAVRTAGHILPSIASIRF